MAGGEAGWGEGEGEGKEGGGGKVWGKVDALSRIASGGMWSGAHRVDRLGLGFAETVAAE
jgi:hypothetical protein